MAENQEPVLTNSPADPVYVEEVSGGVVVPPIGLAIGAPDAALPSDVVLEGGVGLDAAPGAVTAGRTVRAWYSRVGAKFVVLVNAAGAAIFPNATAIAEGDSATVTTTSVSAISRVLNAARSGFSIVQSGVSGKLTVGVSQLLGFLNVLSTGKYVATGISLADGEALAGDSLDNTGAKRVAINGLIQASGNITTATGALTDWVEIAAPGKGAVEVTLLGTYGASTIVAEGKDAAGNWTLQLPLIIKILGTQLAPTAGVYSLALAGGAPATVYNYLVPNAGQLSTRIRATAIVSGSLAVAFAATSEAPHFTPTGTLIFNSVPTTRGENQMGPGQGNNLGMAIVDQGTMEAGESLSLDTTAIVNKPLNDTTYQDSFDIGVAAAASRQVTAAATPITLNSWRVEVLDPTLATGVYQVQFSDSTLIPADGAFTQFLASVTFKHTLGDFTIIQQDVPGNGKKAALSCWMWVSTVGAGVTAVPATKAIAGAAFHFSSSYKA